MLECLACRSRLIEAFQHIQHNFLICKNCFISFIRQYHNNAFHRVSIIGKQMQYINQISPAKIRQIQKALIKFIDLQKIDSQKIFNISVINLFQIYQSRKMESQQLSTEFSSYQHCNEPIQTPKEYRHYANFHWIKQKLLNKYTSLRQNQLLIKVEQNIQPIKDNIIERGSIISNKLSYIKSQLRSLKKEAPSMSELKQLSIGNFFKSKYKNLF